MKKINNLKNFFSIIFITILLSSCSMYKPVEIGKVKGIKLDKLSTKIIKIRLLVEVENPNFYKIKITGYDLNVVLNKHKLSTISNSSTIKFLANSKQVYEFPVDIEIKNIFSSTTLALFDIFKSKEINMQIKGEIYAKALFMRKKIKVNEKNKVKILK